MGYFIIKQFQINILKRLEDTEGVPFSVDALYIYSFYYIYEQCSYILFEMVVNHESHVPR